ncbi:7-dehydrocholesterol reductase [Balamuthia mandrillaris]
MDLLPSSSSSSFPCKNKIKSSSSPKLTKKKAQQWGVDTSAMGFVKDDLSGWLCSLLVLVLIPVVMFGYWFSCEEHNCSILSAALSPLFGSEEGTMKSIADYIPRPTAKAWLMAITWILFQAALFRFLPGRPTKGQPTPTGNVLLYNINGIQALVVTLATFLIASFGLGLFPASIIYHNYGPLLSVASILGFGLSAVMLLKGTFFPTNSDVLRKGTVLYRFFQGTELNPRIGNFDLKLFFIGRVGMMAWPVMNLSYLAAQYEMNLSQLLQQQEQAMSLDEVVAPAVNVHLESGELIFGVSNAMLLVFVLQMFYIVDFFVKEAWYLSTLDIMLDHFGFYLCYGSCVGIPFTYTLQCYYLASMSDPTKSASSLIINWEGWQALAILLLGLSSYVLFRLSNNQRLAFRASGGRSKIWGRPPRFVRAPYRTASGECRENLLLASGYWGLARHFNYLVDLVQSFTFGLCCGFHHIMPHSYTFIMLGLLLHRAARDERRCSLKYGEAWKEYCRLVPAVLIPKVY